MSLDEALEQKIKEAIAPLEEEIAMLRRMLIRRVEPQSDGLVDALEVAKYLGFDVSTEEARKKSLRKVYDRAARGIIPFFADGKRSKRFDLAKVKEALESRSSEAA